MLFEFLKIGSRNIQVKLKAKSFHFFACEKKSLQAIISAAIVNGNAFNVRLALP